MFLNFGRGESSFDSSSRYACHNGIWGDITRNDRSSRHNGSSSNGGAAKHNGTVTNPAVVFHHDLPSIAPWRVPYSLSYDIKAMIISIQEGNVSCHQDAITKLSIALNQAAASKLDTVSQNNVAIWRP
jgi:hypothetical protein